jgi:hypothetical protein
MSMWWLAAGFVVLFVIMTVIGRRRDLRLAKSRAGTDPDEYIRYFTSQGVSRSVAKIVRAYLQDEMTIPDFPVLPADNIADVYGIVDEDLEDGFIELIELCGRSERPDDAELGQVSVDTVEDLVKLVARITRASSGEVLFPDSRIDRGARDHFALLLRRFLNGRITNLEFEQSIEALRWNRRDGAIPGVLGDLERALGVVFEEELIDGCEYKLRDRFSLSPDQRRKLVRLTAFLYADRPYRWRWQKYMTAREAVSIFGSMALFLALISLRHFWLAVLSVVLVIGSAYLRQTWMKSDRRRAEAGQFYPFASDSDFTAARCRPRLFSGSSR